ncbi:Ribosomal RNA-processing protein 1 [Pleurostoma richardsiae]|uniref:Ribosomal RNA-processing protein 1 n=1 Tax=Pleurostoma richardsiae TaxID=41990 RepID=A0AA38RCM7_9PEZI|nr:Ribosomal RNA-processing protein 1 [Pleurostoma richardsiae]
MAAQQNSMPFIKNLASSDRKTRTAALNSLQTFLSSRQHTSSLSPVDVLKLWKGLFYALWMCDRPLPQQALCTELAGLIYSMPRDAVIPWLQGFWATMSREWTAIDVLRMEKFLLLVRRVLGASFQWMKGGQGGTSWDNACVDAILSLLREWPFSIDGDGEDAGKDAVREGEDGDSTNQHSPFLPRLVPAGLRIHVLDIWVDEAEKVGMLKDEKYADDTFELLRGQQILHQISNLVETLERHTASTAVRIRAKDSLADIRLPWNKHPKNHGDARDTDRGEGSDVDSWDGFDD